MRRKQERIDQQIARLAATRTSSVGSSTPPADVLDVSWDQWTGEDFTVSLALYFVFEDDPES